MIAACFERQLAERGIEEQGFLGRRSELPMLVTIVDFAAKTARKSPYAKDCKISGYQRWF